MLHTLRFSLQNAVYFIMLPFFGSCIIHILHTECAKIEMQISGAKSLIRSQPICTAKHCRVSEIAGMELPKNRTRFCVYVEVVTAVSVKVQILWDVTPFSLKVLYMDALHC
jgi:hypothetical protein